jgi:succinyl-CoA synthetase beta subunit
MNIHEYQAKELFDRFGVPSPKGKAASTPKEAYDAAKWLAVKNLVVKAQVHAGGRGKGTFKNGFKAASTSSNPPKPPRCRRQNARPGARHQANRRGPAASSAR